MAATGGINTFERGNKFFELSNHLGNVLTTITDNKLQAQDPSDPDEVEYYYPDIVTATDYYAFGMAMPGRKYPEPENPNNNPVHSRLVLPRHGIPVRQYPMLRKIISP